MTALHRRSFLGALGAGLIVAPAIVKAESLMILRGEIYIPIKIVRRADTLTEFAPRSKLLDTAWDALCHSDTVSVEAKLRRYSPFAILENLVGKKEDVDRNYGRSLVLLS